MSKFGYIVDASALLALIFEEEGARMVAQELKKGVFMTSINVAEVLTKMLREGYTQEEAELIYNMRIKVVDVGQEIATRAAFYDVYTKAFGLSLGDRVCLAAGSVTGRTILTADKIWKKLKLDGVNVQLLR